MAYLGLLIYVLLLYVRPSDWVPGMLGWPLEAIVIAVSMGLALWQHDAGSGRRLPTCLWPLAGWVVMILVSNLVNGTGDGLEVSKLYLKRVVVFLFFFLTLTSTRKLRGLMVWTAMLAAVLGVQAIMMVETGVGWAGQPLYWGGRAAWVGLWNGANILSLLFVSAVPFALEMILGRRSLTWRVIGGGCFGFILGGMFMANSRGGYLALGVTLLVYFRERIGWKGLAVGALVVALLFSLGPSRLSEVNASESSARTRVDMWSAGLEMLKDHPAVGVGKGQFIEHSRDLVAHNVIIQNASETGLVGFFFWLSAVYLSFKALWLVLRKKDDLPDELASAAQAIMASLGGYLAASMFINTDLEPLYILMALAAVVFAAARQCGVIDATLAFDRRDWMRVAGLEVVLLAGMYGVTAFISAIT